MNYTNKNTNNHERLQFKSSKPIIYNNNDSTYNRDFISEFWIKFQMIIKLDWSILQSTSNLALSNKFKIFLSLIPTIKSHTLNFLLGRIFWNNDWWIISSELIICQKRAQCTFVYLVWLLASSFNTLLFLF